MRHHLLALLLGAPLAQPAAAERVGIAWPWTPQDDSCSA